MTRGLLTDDAQLGQPYWWDDATWVSLPDPPPAKVDLLIIGAGFTGLSAAIAAHDAGAKVAVIDAGQPGKGASTRNGGMTGAHPRNGWDDLNRDYGAQVADGLFAEAQKALDFALGLIDQENIECDLQATGRIQLAWTPAHLENQKKTAAHVQRFTPDGCKMIPRAGLGDHINTPQYHGGLYFPGHYALHPWKYHNGMLQAVLNRDIPVSSDCAAQSVARNGAGFVVKTDKGSIQADKIVLGTNGYTKGPFHWFTRRVFPLPSFIIATQQISPNLLGELAPGKRMMVETRARHSYFRLSPDGTRILFGGRASMVHLNPAQAAKRLHATMVEVWPQLADTKVTHAWSGNTGYTFSHMPNVGSHDGIHYSMGYSGSGTVMAPYLGMKAAYQALGDDRGQTFYSHTTLRRHWMHPGGQPHFLKAANMWYRTYVDRAENWAARRSRPDS